MANYSSLLAAVNAAITANGTGAITGPVLNTVLQQMIVSLGQGGYIFKGRAIPTTDPGSPDQNVFYIATTPGTYTNFSSIVVAAGECAILKGSGTSWSKEATGIDLVSVSQNTSTGHTDITIGDTTTPVASLEDVSQLGQDIYNPTKNKLFSDFGFIYVSNGSEGISDSYKVTDYIPLDGISSIKVEGLYNLAISAVIAFYSQKGQVGYIAQGSIAGSGVGSADVVNLEIDNSSIPENAKYVRFGTYVGKINEANFQLNSIVGLTKQIQNVDESIPTQIDNKINLAFNSVSIDDFTTPSQVTLNLLKSGTSIGSAIINSATRDNAGILSSNDKINIDSNTRKLTMNGFIWGANFNGSEGSLAFDSPIELEEDGDSLEIEFGEIRSVDVTTGGYAFSRNVSPTSPSIGVRGIFVAQNGSQIRSDDGTFISAGFALPANSVLKIEYIESKINIYVNNSLISTYNGQKKITIWSFADSVTSQYSNYWDGQILGLKINNNRYLLENAIFSGSATLYRQNGYLTNTQAEQLNVDYMSELYAEKSGTSLILYKRIISNQYIGYPLNKRYLTYTPGQYPSFLDNWGIGRPALYQYLDGAMSFIAYLFNPSEAELAVQVESGSDPSSLKYVGGAAHGFENINTKDGNRCICFVINNKRVSEDGLLPLMPIHSAEIQQETSLYQAYTNSNPFAVATKYWNFNKTGLSIKTSIKILRVLTLGIVQMGMMGVYRHWEGNSSNNYLTKYAIKDSNPYKVYNVADNWESGETDLNRPDTSCRKITMYGDRNLGFSMNIKDPSNNSGYMFVITNGEAYNKIYFTLVSAYTPQVNEELYATQIWEIE